MTVILQGPRARMATVPLQFRASDCLDESGFFARGYGRRLSAVFTRASAKAVVGQNGRLVRLPHHAPPLSVVGGRVSLLLEPARTNLCIRSEEFDTWTDASSCTVTANSIAAPDGATTADLLTATAIGSARTRTCTFTGDGEKCFAIYAKAGTSTRSQLIFRDATAGVTRHQVLVTWTAGVPSLSTSSGAGTLYPVEELANGWYRLLVSATGIVAANSNNVQVYPDNLVGTGTCYFWGAQAEDAVVPSSYIPTAAATVTRSADSLYFPFTLPPTGMTVYVRGVERGAILGGIETRILAITADPLATAAFRMDVNGSGYYRVRNVHTAGSSESGLTTRPTIGQSVELRAAMASTGVSRIHQSLAGAAETSATAGSAVVLDGAWSGTRLHLGGVGTANRGLFAYTEICVALGEQTLETMRELVGV